MWASAKTGGIPVPYNISLLKKSQRDIQQATGPGYTYYAETVGGDETEVAKSAIKWWGYSKIASALSGASKAASADKAKVDMNASNNATAEAINASNNATTVATFVPPH